MTVIRNDPFGLDTLLATDSIGFTGTRHGMTAAQKHTIYHLIQELAPKEAHHGDCVGADADFHQLVREYSPLIHIIGHPPVKDKFRAWCKFDIERPPRDYLSRDRDIIRESHLLIACPKDYQEEMKHSGTWATIRFARQTICPIRIVWPDGMIKEE